MKLCKRAQLIFIYVSFCIAAIEAVNAQPVPSIDLSYRAELVPLPPYRTGQHFTYRQIVTNNSTLFFTYAIIQPVTPIPPNVLPFDSFSPNGSVSGCGVCLSEVCLETPIILPKQSVVCERGFVAGNSVGNPPRLRARVFHPFNIATDPNPSNNEAQVSLEVLPEPIVSVPLSRWSYGLMTLLMLGLGGWVVRRS